MASTLQNNLGHLHLWLLEQLDGTYETYVRAPLASPVAWVVSLGPVGQARLQLKSCTRNSIFLDPKLFQTYQYKKGGWLIAEVVIVFSSKIELTLANERCVVSEDLHSTKT